MTKKGITVEVKGLKGLLKKLERKNLSPLMRRLMTRLAIALEAQQKLHAPVDTGRMRNSISHEVDSRQFPRWSKTGTNVKHRGFPYPKALDDGGGESGRRPYHYKGGGALGQSGELTQGWFTVEAPLAARDQFNNIISQIEKDIKKKWDAPT